MNVTTALDLLLVESSMSQIKEDMDHCMEIVQSIINQTLWEGEEEMAKKEAVKVKPKKAVKAVKKVAAKKVAKTVKKASPAKKAVKVVKKVVKKPVKKVVKSSKKV